MNDAVTSSVSLPRACAVRKPMPKNWNARRSAHAVNRAGVSKQPRKGQEQKSMQIRDLSALFRTAAWLEELIRACRKCGNIYCFNPKLTARVTRRARALRASLWGLQEFLHLHDG